jgi:glycosyltransferase involved in cell wall biosynthesis
LTEADCAVSAQHEHLETRFAFRTRILDCLWAGLPVVCTSGDDLSAQVRRDGLGAVAPSGDAGALAAAMAGVLDRGRAAYAGALARAAAGFEWPVAAVPLVRWVTADGALPPRLRPTPAPLLARARSAAYEAGGRRLLALR